MTAIDGRGDDKTDNYIAQLSSSETGSMEHKFESNPAETYWHVD